MNDLDDLAKTTAREITSLYRRQADCVKQGRTLLDSRKAGPWTTADDEEFRKLMTGAREAREALTAKLKDLGGSPPDLGDEEGVLKWCGESRNADRNPTEGASVPLGGHPTEATKMTTNSPGLAARSYRSMFNPEGRALDKGGFKNFGDFLSTIHEGRHDPRLTELRTMTGSIPADGGFSVPTEFAGWLLDKSLESEIVRPRCQVWPMTSSERVVPAWDASDHGSGLFGGITATWLAENATATRVQPKMRQIGLKAGKLAIFTQVSNELRQDGLSLEEQLGGAMVTALGWYLDWACIRGTGAGQPKGLLTDAALITVDAEPGQVADSLIYENACSMFSRLLPGLMDGAIWLANPTTIPHLLTLAVNVGTGGSAVPVLKESSGKFYLLGKEVIFTEKLPVLGDKGDLVLVNFQGYALGIRKEITLDKSNAAAWLSDGTDYRVILRADGQGVLNKPITMKDGVSQSWCVTLAARA